MKQFLVFIIAALISGQSLAEKLKIVTTTTDLAWVAKKIGKNKVRVVSLLNGTEDAHFLDAKPSYIRKVSMADIVCFNGLALEVGWLPKVLSKSGNAKVQNGGKGHCDASKTVAVLDKVHGSVDRSMGDVHPEGNPHYTLSPDHLIQASKTVMSTMVGVDIQNAKFYVGNYKKLKKELQALKKSIQQRLARSLGSKPIKVLQYHKEFSYFLKSYGFIPAGALEPVPGVPPSAGRLAELGLSAEAKDIKIAIGAHYSPQKLLKKFTRVSKVPHLILPVSIQKRGSINSYKKLQTHLADQMIEKLKR